MLKLKMKLIFKKENTMETRKLTVSGLVQGVGFRWSTMALANKMNIPGTVKNNSDGTVTIYLQSTPDLLKNYHLHQDSLILKILHKNLSQMWNKCMIFMYYIRDAYFIYYRN